MSINSLLFHKYVYIYIYMYTHISSGVCAWVIIFFNVKICILYKMQKSDILNITPGIIFN